MVRCPPILKRPYASLLQDPDGFSPPKKPWTAYILPGFAIFLLLLPQPSWFIVISSQYVDATPGFIHISVTTLLTLLCINSLAICCFRDPGRPQPEDMDGPTPERDGQDENDALMDEDKEDPNDFNSSRKWCRTCWAPKPDRTHHCSTCGRCVLRMDHHCPWISQCVGHRTHMAFLHLLGCITLLAAYITVVASYTLYRFLFAPLAKPIDDITPLHCLILVIIGFVFSLVMGSFFGFHIYLCATNQTTLETLSPYMLLKYLPKPKAARHPPGTSITRGIDTVPPPRNRAGENQSEDNDSPYYFPSPPATPPPENAGAAILSELRDTLLAHNPLSTIPASTPSTPPKAQARATFSSASPVATTSVSDVFINAPSGGPATLSQNGGEAGSTGGYHEWDEHSLSLSQSRLVRRTAAHLRLWDIGIRRNIVATLGSGAIVDGNVRGNGERNLRPRRSAHTWNDPLPYSWRWWITVLLYGGPPRGDGKTFPRNPQARGVLEELRRGLEELEKRELGGSTERRIPAGTARRPPYDDSRYTIGDEMELDEV
ncbi:related to zinc finger DHHC domain containing protein 2 [Serendipita indica DSM 11827]|uniref:Palmitoyltransferase n=1 Tax=Serendipita indica (strain DSM 11827) TaxID=1109443 RepID=G4TZ08_SERID|nr:related to zinc finger DHHC domain containing protein 2 [Serendipita indica DSM 11827]